MRAANLGERFDRTGGASSRCAIRGKLTTAPNVPVTLVQGGNPDVASRARGHLYGRASCTARIWLEGFDVSVDWLRRESRKGSIEQFPAQDIVNACYNQNNQDQCANITLDAPGEFTARQPDVPERSQAKISGIDVEMGYSSPIELLRRGEASCRRGCSRAISRRTRRPARGDQDRPRRTGGGHCAESSRCREKRRPVRSTTDGGRCAGFLQLRYIGQGVYDTQNGIGMNNWVVADNTIGSIAYSIRGCRTTCRSAAATSRSTAM